MKSARVINRHKRDCWYRENDKDERGWFFDTYKGVYHDNVRNHRFIYMECNCPGCPARLRVNLDLLENYAVRLYTKDEA